MKLRNKSEWFELDSPLAEPSIRWSKNEKYLVERIIDSKGAIIWFGCSINWQKLPDGEWTELATNENAKPLEKYLPEIIYGDDRTYFKPCGIPLYEQMYMELMNNHKTKQSQ